MKIHLNLLVEALSSQFGKRFPVLAFEEIDCTVSKEQGNTAIGDIRFFALLRSFIVLSISLPCS